MPRYLSLPVALALVALASAQEPAPVVDGAEPEALRASAARVHKASRLLNLALTRSAADELGRLVADRPKAPESLVGPLQKLLDRHCLIFVAINPESRVKAARGPAEALLQPGRDAYFLVKVHNEAGVTHPLTVQGPQLVGKGKAGEGKWLEAEVFTGAPMLRALTGQRVEYVLLRLRAREAGKREATLGFDVGQGTQDLGFRAEVPILFTVPPPER